MNDIQKEYLKSNNRFVYENDDGSFTITNDEKDPFVIVEELGTIDDYVYDIETEEGVFQAGVGRLIVKNTDSIYTQFLLPNQDSMTEREQLEKIFEVSKECADRISDTFIKPIELEFEKVMNPVLLFTKKRYLMNYRENIDDIPKMDAKGIQIVRRDNCPYVREVLTEIANKILNDRDIKGAEDLAKQRVKDLLDGKVPIEKLTLSKTLKKSYKETNKDGRAMEPPAHWHLAQKMKARDPATAPQPGERVPFVFIDCDAPKQAQKAEDPEYVKKNGLKIDTLYYLEHQLQNPLETIFELLVTDKNGQVYPDTKEGLKAAHKEIEKRLWTVSKTKKMNQKKGNREITDFFAPK